MPDSAPMTSSGSVAAETARVRRIMDRLAPGYDRQMAFFERLLFAGGREWVCSRVFGDVLEMAVGTGRNLPYYPAGTRLTGLELSPAMLDLGRRRAEQLGLEVDLRVGDAQVLDFDDESFDTVVCTLALCTIPDDRQAVQEARRVLRPGGRFLLLEHVRSTRRWVRAGQRVWNTFSVRFEGDHAMREPLDHLRAEGFQIAEVQRLKLGLVERIAARKAVG
jgi:ubiquinone/menaquinone biosynthesis C-methylase UbiE